MKIIFFLAFNLIFSTLAIGQQRGSNVQIQEPNSLLIADCVKLGPVNLSFKAGLLQSLADGVTTTSKQKTLERGREVVEGMGGDTLVVLDLQSEYQGAIWKLQGVAMSCYGKGVRGNNNLVMPSPMACQVDADCGTGSSCRSKRGGGTECRAVNSEVLK